MRKRILLVGNSEIVIYKFRKEIVEQLIRNGHEVAVAFPTIKKNYGNYFQSIGCKYYDIEIDRRGTNPFKDINLIHSLSKIVKEYKPTDVLSYTIKPNLYLSLILYNKKCNFFPTITGFGSALENNGLLSNILFKSYKIIGKVATLVYVQNSDARKVLLNRNVVNDKKIRVLPGSGVNLNEFKQHDLIDSKSVTFLFLGRIMKDKGIYELIAATEMLVENYPNCIVKAIGFNDDPDLLSFIENSNSPIEFIDFIEDVKSEIHFSSCVVLPSYHEGMSNVLLEAAAMGRPLIASDIPGCREIVYNEKNGFLVQPKDVESLYLAMEKFVKLSFIERNNMANYSRQLAQDYFSRQIIVDTVIDNIEKGGTLL